MVSINPSYTHAASRGFTCVRRLPGPQLRLDPQAGVELCYVHTGCLSFRFGGETVPVRAGQHHSTRQPNTRRFDHGPGHPHAPHLATIRCTQSQRLSQGCSAAPV